MKQRNPLRGPGQATVEFALVGGILLLMLFGILEVGRLMYMSSELENAASEAAQYAALNCSNDPGFVTAYTAKARSKLVLADKANLVVSPIVAPTCEFCPIRVTVSDTWSSVVPVIGNGLFVKSSTKLIEYVPSQCP